MLIASTCLVVIALAAWIRSGQKHPLDPDDVHRLRRVSEKLQRENSLPFE